MKNVPSRVSIEVEIERRDSLLVRSFETHSFNVATTNTD
jgi:hypothetical protein